MIGQNSNTYEETFYIIPRYIRHLEGMTLTYLDFYETIFQFLNKGKSCFLSNALIKQRTGIQSDSRINMAFQFFEKHNILKRVYKNNKRYILPVFCEISTDDGVSLEREEGISTERGGVSLQRDINKEVLNKEINIKENTNFVSIKENEIVSVFEAAQECLENTKNNLPATTSNLKPNNYKETNYPVKKEQAISILMAINCLGLSEIFLQDLIKQRKAQGASTNDRALKAVYKELIKLKELGFNLDECLDDYANSSWRGFKAEYFINKKSRNVKDRHSHDWGTEWIDDCNFAGAI